MPHIFQYNKRDLPKLATVEELNAELNKHDAPYFDTCATTGMGILEGLTSIAKVLMKDLNRKGVVDRRKVRAFVPRSKTDSLARPLVGSMVASGAGEATVQVDPSAATEHDSLFKKTDASTPFYDSVYGDGDGPEIEMAFGTDYPEPRPSTAGLSFDALFEDAETAKAMKALESIIPKAEPANIVEQARAMFELILNDETSFPSTLSEPDKIVMLGVSLRRYAHFQRILGYGTLDSVDCLFIVHFLTDLQIGKTIG